MALMTLELSGVTSAGISGVDHVAVIVHDIDRALPYYIDQLGFTLLNDELALNDTVRLAYLDCGPGSSMIQLVCPLRPGPLADYLESRGEGLHHICFTVEDIAATLAALAPGAEIAVGMGGRGRRTAFLPAPPNGLITELTERLPFEG
jgi:methylmalonyl-CoA/ethylmalonyl-CoA epimerase